MLLTERRQITMTAKQEMDRVCGMWVEIQGAQLTSVYKGETYYFCSRGCKEQFDREPERFMVGFEGRKP
jgi:YHS domain-containing protein